MPTPPITRRTAMLSLAAAALPAASRRRSEEVRRIPAPEANQAVAADDSSLYAIGNHAVARYDKKSGHSRRLAGWEM